MDTEFIEILRRLNKNKVGYVLIGGLAMYFTEAPGPPKLPEQIAKSTVLC